MAKAQMAGIMFNNLCQEIVLTPRPMMCTLGTDMKQIVQKNPKYQFSRNWLVAEFDTEYYHEVRDWCIEHFGLEDRFPNAWSRWQHRYEDRIFFRDQKDYQWFLLRWGA